MIDNNKLLEADKFFNSVGYGDLDNFIQSCKDLKIIILNKSEFKCINDLKNKIKELEEDKKSLELESIDIRKYTEHLVIINKDYKEKLKIMKYLVKEIY